MALQKATATITDETPLIPQDVTDIKTELELQNVSNTSDADKPVSIAQQNALNLKQDILSEGAFVDGDKTKLDGIESLAEVNTINSDPTGITGADQIINAVSMTQAEYDLITPNASTLYVING